MRNFARAAVALAALTTSVPALAVSVLNPDNSVFLDKNDPFSWTFDYDGFSDGGAISGLKAQIKFDFTGVAGNSYLFSYTMKNTTVAPIDAARITIFGFNTNPNITGVTTGAGDLFNVTAAGNQPNGLADIDICFKDAGNQNNCTGANGGLLKGAQTSGTFVLTFANALNSIVMSDFSVRFQGIESQQLGIRDGSASGLGRGVPEPATWAMMIGGFGLLGVAARRRRRMQVTFA